MNRSTAPDAPIRVLIVDDHPVVRDGLRGIFENEPGIDVVGEAAGGNEAVARVAALEASGGVDVLLLDLRMPAGGGVEAIAELRRRDPRRPRILVLTTYDTDREIRGAMAAGADGYLLKDTRRDDLLRAVTDLAAGRPVLAPAALRALSGRADEPEALTPRELEVLQVVAGGGTNRAAADRLFVSEATVKTHLLRVYAKLGVADRAAAVRVAYERGLL